MFPEMLGHLWGVLDMLDTFVSPPFGVMPRYRHEKPFEENLSHLYIYVFLKKLLCLAITSCRSKHVTILFHLLLGEQHQTLCILSLKQNDARRHHPMRPSYDQQIEQEDGRANDKNASADDSIQHVMMSWHIYIHLPSDSRGFLCVLF